MATCRVCKIDIPQGTQVVLWETKDDGLYFSFVCLVCSEKLEKAGMTKDITEEVKS